MSQGSLRTDIEVIQERLSQRYETLREWAAEYKAEGDPRRDESCREQAATLRMIIKSLDIALSKDSRYTMAVDLPDSELRMSYPANIEGSVEFNESNK